MKPLFLIVFAIVMANASDHAEARDRVYAKIYGKEYLESELIEKTTPKYAIQARAAEELAKIALPALVKQRIPNCQMTPTDLEVEKFISSWQEAIQELRERITSAEPRRSIFDMADDINNQNAKAVSIAREEISTWRAYQCVHDLYRGEMFFVSPDAMNNLLKAAEKLDSKPQKNKSEQSWEALARMAQQGQLVSYAQKDNYPFPIEMLTPVPTDSLAQFYKAARKDKEFEIKDRKVRSSFNYKFSDDFRKLTFEDVQQEFQSPDWLQAE